MNIYRKIIKVSQTAFQKAVLSVQPHSLLKEIALEGSTVKVRKKSYPFKNIYLVGFGKAVAGMIAPLEDALRGITITRGVVSVPYGFKEALADKNWFRLPRNPNIRMLEGAKNNLPDIEAQNSTQEIIDLVHSLGDEDLLFVLISGGGSALLPMPEHPLTLDEKTQLIRSLSRAGATIDEINIVRKLVSATKGGKLAMKTKAQIVSFILSDIIDDPLDLIASGPTVPNLHTATDAKTILNKYRIPTTPNLESCFGQAKSCTGSSSFTHVDNYLIGNNRSALEAASGCLTNQTDLGCVPIIASHNLAGNANEVGQKLATLGYLTLKSINQTEEHWKDKVLQLLEDLKIDVDKIAQIQEALEMLQEGKKSSICLLLGGETVVKVTGQGRGGRNQELVLSASITLDQLCQGGWPTGTLVLLSGGTDGMDGPTDAAGAITYYESDGTTRDLLTKDAFQSSGLRAEEYLLDNDSYTYFSKVLNGEYLIKTGHTGTNVMDIILLFIKP